MTGPDHRRAGLTGRAAMRPNVRAGDVISLHPACCAGPVAGAPADRAARAGRRPQPERAGKEWDVHESEWAVRANSLRLTFDAFCGTHERAWIGIARARLPEETAALEAVQRMKDRLWRHWGRLLREKVPAFHAWALIKEEVGAALAERAVGGESSPAHQPAPAWG